MPIPPPAPTAPYDTVNTVLNTARTRINDAIASLGGDMLSDNQPFTQQMAITAWRKFQSYIANLGFSRLRRRVILTAFPVVASTDPAIETYLNWSEFYDGQSLWIPPYVGVLPQDFILPYKVAERPTGQMCQFSRMAMGPDGFPNQYKRPFNRWWDWRNDAIFMPGSTLSMDLEIYYASFLADFATVGEVEWYNQPVPIMRCLSSLANYVCAEFGVGRGDLDVATFRADAEADARMNFNVEAAQKQRTSVSRRSCSGRGGRWGGGMNGGL